MKIYTTLQKSSIDKQISLVKIYVFVYASRWKTVLKFKIITLISQIMY